MARPYQTPMERKRMGGMPEPAMPSGDEAMAEEEVSATEKVEEPISSFLPKEALGGRSFKAGDRLEFEVVDMDPETGEIEVRLTEGEVSEPEMASGGSMADMMPEE